MSESLFKVLSEINVNHRTEKKNKLTYLSWAWAWSEVCKRYPDANYVVDHYDGKPYLYDEILGYLVSTRVTIDGKTIPMSLPVMDGANNAMKSAKYSYQVAEWANGRKTGKMIDKWVEPATMFDINKTMMRCLVKNLAMFGLGLYIYAGEDMPDIEPEPIPLIDDNQITAIKSLIEGKGFTVEQALQLWKLSSLSDIQVNSYNNFLENVKSWNKVN